jgi:hypothetical protein
MSPMADQDRPPEVACADDPLRRLRDELDREFAVLRAPGAGKKLREIFAASPQDIADAANAAED